MYKHIISAKIYSRAIFLYSLENKCISNWYNMLMFITNVINNNKIHNIFSNKYFPETKVKILTKLSKNYINYEFKNFIKIVSFNHCLKIIPYIFKYFIIFYNQYKNKKNIKILSAYKLSKSQSLNIETIIKKKVSNEVNISYKIDKSILAGIIIHINDFLLDGSLLNKINFLKKNIF